MSLPRSSAIDCKRPACNMNSKVSAHPKNCATLPQMTKCCTVFEQSYRVVSAHFDRLLLRGIVSGATLTILNSGTADPICIEDYPRGKLISLTDPH